MKKTFTAVIDYVLRGVQIQRHFPSARLCRRYMCQYAGLLEFEHGYSVQSVKRLDRYVVAIRLSCADEIVCITFIREA